MAAVIGCIAGVLVIEAVFFVERKLKIDDPVGAIAVHGVCGTFGVLSVGLFANGSYGAGWNGTDRAPRASRASSGATAASSCPAPRCRRHLDRHLRRRLRLLQDPGQDLEVDGQGRHPLHEEDEIAGLDLPEMGVLAYPSSWHPTPSSGREADPVLAAAALAARRHRSGEHLRHRADRGRPDTGPQFRSNRLVPSRKPLETRTIPGVHGTPAQPDGKPTGAGSPRPLQARPRTVARRTGPRPRTARPRGPQPERQGRHEPPVRRPHADEATSPSGRAEQQRRLRADRRRQHRAERLRGRLALGRRRAATAGVVVGPGHGRFFWTLDRGALLAGLVAGAPPDPGRHSACAGASAVDVRRNGERLAGCDPAR